MKTEIRILYQLFDYEDEFKWKNFELQSCRSHRKLQISYKIYLHLNTNKINTNFSKQIEPPHHGATVPRAFYRHGAWRYVTVADV
jgi:hypothetical protein